MDLRVKEESVEISFLIPCYNEARNVSGALDLIQSVMESKICSYEILVVDDGSTDETMKVVEVHCRTHPAAPVKAYRNPKNMGLGWNYIYWAKKARGRYYMLVNGDNDTRVDDLSEMIDARGRVDILVPYLMNQNERPLVRRILSQSFTFLVNQASGHKLKYYNGPVLHLRDNVASFELGSSDYAYQAKLLCWCLDRGKTFLEFPYRTIVERQGNSSALRIPNAFSVLRTLWHIFLNRWTKKSRKASPDWKEKLPVV